jgi:SHAQKYF class myb-like DNA-binding protein
MSPSGPGLNLHAQTQQQQQQARKARRCWSPELHRQFVAALHQLGGPQVATPKQIREVMQVDGLTNDEVKSHLQVSNYPFYLSRHLYTAITSS